MNMNLILRLIPFYFLCLSTIVAKAQADITQPKIIPASPTADGLGLYGSIPISYYTGLADVSIPIHELKGREITLPISLSYRGSGVKVEDNASWVGLGWSLNSGGVITRAIRDKSDFSSNPAVLPLPVGIEDRFNALHHSYFSGYDLEPDVFYYNFNGKSGSFVFDRLHNAKFNHFDDIKVQRYFTSTPSGADEVKFEITTSDGTKYIFDARETGMTADPTAWFLTKIISPSGKEVFDFIYENESYRYQIAARYDESISLAGGRRSSGYDNTPINISGKRLKQINTNTVGKIEFIPNSQLRKDLLNGTGYALKDIVIYNSNNEILKKFRLETEDIETSIRLDPGNGIYWYSEYLNWRMYLKSLTEYDATETLSKPPYKFSYFDRDINGKDKLPHRVSYAQDHWGYYNGQDNNASLIETYVGPFGTWDPVFDAFQPICLNASINYNYKADFSYTYFTGNRTPSFPDMRGGTLKTIQYPTGGYTDFEYEPHQGNYESQEVLIRYTGIVGGMRIKNITTFDNCSDITGKREFTYSLGKLFSYPKYRTYTFNNGGDPGIFQICGITFPNDYDDSNLYLTLSPNSFTHPSSTKGSNIGYYEVKEFVAGNGCTIYNYGGTSLLDADENFETLKFISKPATFFPEERDLALGSYFTWPYNPSKNNDWRRGLLIKKTIENAYGNLVQSEIYEYGFKELGTVWGMRMKMLRNGIDFYYAQYQIPYGWSYLKEKTIIERNPLSNSYHSTTTKMIYEPLFKYKQRDATSTSDGDSLINSYKYPFNYNAEPYISMTGRNIVSPVIEVQSFKGTRQLSTTSKFYKDWFNDQSLFSPELVQIKHDINSLPETRLKFHSISSNGNVLSVSKEKASPVSYIWDYKSSYPVAEVKNASEAEIAYSSFEADGHGNWQYGSGTTVDPNAKTGLASYSLTSSNSITKTGLLSTKTYVVSYWSRNGSYDVNGIIPTTGPTNFGWTYYEHQLTNLSQVTIIGNGQIDELRLFPKGAFMTTYCYKPGEGIIASTDEANKVTYYNYDGLGRMIMVRDQDKNILKKLDYNYNTAGQAACNQVVYYNVEKSQSFFKGNCVVAIPYKVSAKTFSSFISQADADQKAQSVIDKYGQAYINSNGICVYYNVDKSGNYTAIGCPAGYYGREVYVSVPANLYSSTSSQAEADALAVEYAQNYANVYGCSRIIPETVNVNYDVNQPGFRVKLINDATHIEYDYELSIGGGLLGQVPSGSYTITIYSYYDTSTHTFGAAEYTATGSGSITFYSVSLDVENISISVY
ncbi:DUF5977 domain-containing protein [Pedobacter sp. MC2016-14]|uniref:DUF5977 domain-containing protein n=1 Tax=Pedobacter sp. MC2016-14 TaxID=2897327 RepID=UPI001E340835|nr:DUF5977 domain-containing protein [Pedobacter sp. MC2016-14]MCD0487944.1 DUF5977 domain-containing protein [Pedobacter sp. MC2016-14]